MVQPCLYRSNAPVEANFPFLVRLKLQTVLHLSPELPTRGTLQLSPT